MFLLATCETLVEVLDNISTHAFNRLDASSMGPGSRRRSSIERGRACSWA